MSAPGTLLAVDGDNFAHRSYHALPKTIRGAGGRPANALVGVANYLLRLWDAEQPGGHARRLGLARDADLPARGTRAYQAGRVFDAALLEQLALLPALVESFGFTAAKGAGYEADDFLAARPRAWDGPVLVATADRDAFQLVSDRVTVLQPASGGAFVRVGPAEVRERYGVEPGQVPDFIALRGDASDKIPGAPGVGPKTAATILAPVREPRGGARRGPLLDDRRRPAPLPADRARWTRTRRFPRLRRRSRPGRAPPSTRAS